MPVCRSLTPLALSYRCRTYRTGTHRRDWHCAIALATALALLPAMASAGQAITPETGTDNRTTWQLDPVHTRVLFAISHAGFSQALGTVSGSQGVLRFDPQDWSRTQLQVTVPLDRLDLGDADWNRAALAGNLLDVKHHPVAQFVSTSATGPDAGHARVCGDLSLRGVTRPLCLEVTLNAIKRHPMPPFRRTAGFSATAALSRSDYGIDAWPSMIGDQVTLRIEAEAVRASRSAADGLPEPGDLQTEGELPPPAVEQPAVGQPAVEQPPVAQPAVEQPATAPPAVNPTGVEPPPDEPCPDPESGART
jgi:polyisoprenoid-binding protein YceI